MPHPISSPDFDIETSEDQALHISGIDVDCGELLSASDMSLSDSVHSDDEDRISYEDDVPNVSDDEIEENLEAYLGPDEDQAFWSIRKFQTLSTGHFIHHLVSRQ